MAKPVKEEVQLPQEVAQRLDDGPSLEGESTEQKAVVLASTIGDVQSRNSAIMQNFVEWLVAKANTTDADQYAVMASIIAEIREAQNPTELLRERSALHVRDILNTPLILHGFDIREGSYEESELNYYAAMTMGRQGTEHTRIVTCGATKVLAKLWRLEEFNEWPLVVWFTGKQTGAGYVAFDMLTPSV